MKKVFCFLMMVLVVCLCGCSNGGKRLAQIRKRGKLVVYADTAFPPFEYLTREGRVEGCEIDIMKKLAKRLRVELSVVPKRFSDILPAVQSGEADLGVAGITITEERLENFDFSQAYVRSVQYLFMPENSPIAYVEDLAGKRVGCKVSTTGCRICRNAIDVGALAGQGTVLKEYDAYFDGFSALNRGEIDGFVIDEMVALGMVRRRNGFKAVPLMTKDGRTLDTVEEFGTVVMKGEKALLREVNRVIREMLADGSFKESVKRHNDAAFAEKKD